MRVIRFFFSSAYDERMKRIVIVQGHPDPSADRYCHALADAYVRGAQEAGHDVTRVAVGSMAFDFVRSASAWQQGEPAPEILSIQESLASADHLVIVYPLWLGDVPAMLKAFLEHLFRPHFAGHDFTRRSFTSRPLKGKSARVVVTMGMPAWFYNWYFRKHSVKSLERNILGMLGFSPIGESIIGSVENSKRSRSRWLRRMESYGRNAS